MSNSCVNCGLSSGKHMTHDDISMCVKLAKEAISKLSKYRLLEGEHEKISDKLRRETLEIAYTVHRKEMHEAMKEPEIPPKTEGEGEGEVDGN
jgi:hypothetical protein